MTLGGRIRFGLGYDFRNPCHLLVPRKSMFAQDLLICNQQVFAIPSICTCKLTVAGNFGSRSRRLEVG